MIEVHINEDQIALAYKKAEEMGTIKNSIRVGKGNIVGFLGEIIFADYYGGMISNTYDYDVIINGVKVDVKTKETTVTPQKDYLCSIAGFNVHQKCDVYYFVRINKGLTKGWLLGGMPKSEYFKKATFNRAGDIDKSSFSGWKFKADCYNLEIYKLEEMKKLLDRL